MPRRSILSTTEQMSLLALPESQNDLIRYYTFTETDFALIRQRRGDANRLGFAVQLCLLRYPGSMLGSDLMVAESVIQWVASQIQVDATAWVKYAERDETRREHFQELRSYLGLSPFSLADFRLLIKGLSDLAMQTDKGLVIALQATEILRQRQIILPALNVIDRACAEAITLATRRIYKTLIEPLTAEHKQRLDNLLKVKPETGITWLVWLRQSPVKPNSRHMLEQIERLKTFQKLALPVGIGRDIHQNRLLKMAREGGRMTPQDLAKFEVKRRYATLVALALEGTATVTDQLIDLHDRILVKMFSTAKHKHHQQFQDKGKAINDKVRLYSKVGHALLYAKESDSDPFEAIEKVISWEDFMLSITEADQLSQPESFDHLYLVTKSFNMLRRYTPEFLNVLQLNAAPAAQRVLDAITVIRGMNARGSRKMPEGAPTTFVKPRWKPLVIVNGSIDPRFYEICALSELKNSLRSGDIWVSGSRQFRNFDQQSYRASGLNLVTAAIVLWNTVYIERAIEAQREMGKSISDDLLPYLSPLGWEHINLTGDYVWRQNKASEAGQFRPLRISKMLK